MDFYVTYNVIIRKHCFSNEVIYHFYKRLIYKFCCLSKTKSSSKIIYSTKNNNISKISSSKQQNFMFFFIFFSKLFSGNQCYYFFGTVTLCKAAQVCCLWGQLTEEPSLWRKFCCQQKWRLSKAAEHKQVISHMSPEGSIQVCLKFISVHDFIRNALKCLINIAIRCT